MKILQIDKYFYLKGGAETVFFNTIDLLREKGHEVIPFALKSSKNRPSEYASYFVDYPELSESSLWTRIRRAPAFLYNSGSARMLEKLILAEKPDLAHIHLLFNGMSVSILPVLRKYNIPIVMTAHDYRLICPAYTFTNGGKELCERCIASKQYWRCITGKCSKGNLPNSVLLSLDTYFREQFYPPVELIDRFIFVSKFSQGKHIEAAPRYREKSTHLYNFTPVAPSAALSKENYLLYFGRISEEKGVATLLEAMKRHPGQSLKVVGTGPLLESLQQSAPPSVSFLGFKQGEELNRLIQQASFVIVPSEWYENNPLTIIESMTLGTPVIGSRIGGIPELIEENKTGFLFRAGSADELAGAIAKARGLDAGQYEAMTEAARAFARDNFSKEAHYQRLMQIYESALQSVCPQ